MIALYLAIWLFALAASAFCSGSETGLFRAPRLRLVADAISGDRAAKGLLFLLNRPPLFVATILVGNNIANYLLGLALVLFVQEVWGSDAGLAELLVLLATSPLVFIFGELAPKHVFYQAPYRLIRWLTPFILLLTLLLAPISIVLWGLGTLLERLVGQSPTKARVSLARHELERILRESQEVGLLQIAQRDLAQNLFATAARPVSEFAQPFHRLPHLRKGDSRAAALKRAQRDQIKVFAVTDSGSREPLGYLRTIDLLLSQSEKIEESQELPKIVGKELHGDALIEMQSQRWAMALIVDDAGKGIGLVTFDNLIDPLLAGPLSTLSR